ncbi:hypothetical protein L3Q82_001371 [Scortum barcoo]|uniref:Uncharacterized protein n=1 Tax=Scortum barcoo TaxID=214431 RepID=A0ACB8W943_9TELE|nr:hypothetical protein L3Q82_001371 [Scortum barcoo]
MAEAMAWEDEQLDCGRSHKIITMSEYGTGTGHAQFDQTECTRFESVLPQDTQRQYAGRPCNATSRAGVVCTGLLSLLLLTECEKIRLVGPSRCSGRVEVYHRDSWGTVCDDHWSLANAAVVCRELNCGTVLEAKKGAFFGEGKEEIWLDDVQCSGTESSILKCTHKALGDNNCGHGEDAGVICSEHVKVVNGSSRCNGRVEIYHGGHWKRVCSSDWDKEEAEVLCQEINCGNAVIQTEAPYFGEARDLVGVKANCSGNESSLSQCGFQEMQEGCVDATVVCANNKPMRLMNGTNRCSGRVEVYHDGHWGTVCDDRWGMQEATVACREMNCGTALAVKYKAFFGRGQDQVWLDDVECTGHEKSLVDCPHRGLGEHDCDHNEDAGVECSGDPPLRLANGTDRCSGRVEVLHDGQWGTVCDDDWDIRDAQVVCRAMDCGTAQTSKSSAFFGQGQGDIWLDDVGCVGNETSLLHCRHPTLGENNCGHGEDAGVVCSATIRLINGTDQCSGRVEFHHGDHWAPAYKVNWGMNEATVVCREMNCGDPVKVSGSFGRGTDLRGYQVSCSGRESSLTQCTLREYVRTSQDNIEEAAVECSGNVKLAGGNNRCIGRVEFFNKGQWGTVCGEYWDVNDGMVVCRQLDCGRVHKITTTTEFGTGTGQTFIDQIECNGLHSSLSQCTQIPFRGRTCNATSVAGVICTGSLEVRLANSDDECSGRVEVRNGDLWQTVCDSQWTLSKGQVVCEQLECGHAVDAHGGAHFGQGIGSVVEATDSCFDNVTSLQQCSLKGYRSSTCGHERDAGVICAAQIRLVSGSSECSGRVEVLYRGQWGTVCDDEWRMTNADVVCRQLGCGHAVSAPTSAHFGRGTGPIWLDNVECTGLESALSHCRHPNFGENNCGHGEDAGVICLGALDKPQITLSPGPQVNWGERVEITCTVVTEHVGGTFVLKKTESSFKMEKYSDNDAVTFTFPSVDFSQKGLYFCEYQKKLPHQVIYYPQGNTAELSITVKLEKPSISLTSPHSMVIFSPDKISLNEGSSFSVTCSIHSRYAGGFFHLTEIGTNATETKEAVGYSVFYLAYFEFSEIEKKQQGDYQCVYGINISSESFCSIPSKSLRVNVIGTTVQFTNRFAAPVKQDVDERTNGLFDGRDSNTQVKEPGHSRPLEDKNAEADSENCVEKVPEDLAGRMRKRQDRIFSILESKKILFQRVDISQNSEDKDLMRKLAGNPTALPPQIVNGNNYCGPYFYYTPRTLSRTSIFISTMAEESEYLLHTSLIHDGLARGIREATKALDKRQAHLCALAANCDEPMYVKLVEALCAEHNINLIKVDDNKKLGEWVGLCKIDREGKPRKVVGCSCVVVKDIKTHDCQSSASAGAVLRAMQLLTPGKMTARDYGKESQAKDVIEEYFKAKK